MASSNTKPHPLVPFMQPPTLGFNCQELFLIMYVETLSFAFCAKKNKNKSRLFHKTQCPGRSFWTYKVGQDPSEDSKSN